MFNVLPPLFWPILMGLLAFGGVLGIISKLLQHHYSEKQQLKTKHDTYYEEVEITFGKVSELFIQAQQNNIDLVTKQKAWESVRLLHPALFEKRGEKIISANPFDLQLHDVESISKWYGVLLDERIRCNQEREMPGRQLKSSKSS